MHELSICYALLEQLQGIATREGGGRVVDVTLRIGPLSGVEPELLARAFPLAVAGSLAEGARLRIDTQPVRVHCDDCGRDSDATPNRLTCGDCGGFHTHLISGDEMLLARLELERDSLPEGG